MADAGQFMLPWRPSPPRSMPCPQMKAYASPGQWLRHKDQIGQLYLNENKTLHEVRRIMKADHGFIATPKMWKSKITAWGFDRKNLKKEDGQEILRQVISLAQKNQPLPAAFPVRGRHIDTKQAERYLRRSLKIDVLTIYGARRQRSPSSALCTPNLRGIEVFLYTLTAWGKSNPENGAWRFRNTSSLRFPIHPLMDDFLSQLGAVRDLCRLGRTRDAWHVLAVLEVDQFVQSATYASISALHDHLSNMNSIDHVTAILRRCSEEAAHSFPKNDVRRAIFENLGRTDLREIKPTELRARTQRCMFDVVVGSEEREPLDMLAVARNFGQTEACERLLGNSPVLDYFKSEAGHFELNHRVVVLLDWIARAWLVPTGRVQGALEILNWLQEQADSLQGSVRQTALRASMLLRSCIPRAQNNAEDQAGALLQIIQQIRDLQEPKWCDFRDLIDAVDRLDDLGETYSEIMQELHDEIDVWLSRLLPNKRCGRTQGRIIDNGSDSSDNPAAAWQDGPDSAADSAEDSVWRNQSEELPEMWPCANDLGDYDLSFDWEPTNSDQDKNVPQLLDFVNADEPEFSMVL